MLQPRRSRRPLALEQHQLAEIPPREGRAQFKRGGEIVQPLRQKLQGRLVAIGEALHQTSIAEKRLPASVIVALQMLFGVSCHSAFDGCVTRVKARSILAMHSPLTSTAHSVTTAERDMNNQINDLDLDIISGGVPDGHKVC